MSGRPLIIVLGLAALSTACGSAVAPGLDINCPPLNLTYEFPLPDNPGLSGVLTAAVSYDDQRAGADQPLANAEAIFFPEQSGVAAIQFCEVAGLTECDAASFEPFSTDTDSRGNLTVRVTFRPGSLGAGESSTGSTFVEFGTAAHTCPIDWEISVTEPAAP